jgi:hypothetical protein
MKFTAILLVMTKRGRFSGRVRSRRFLSLSLTAVDESSTLCTRAPQGAPFLAPPSRWYVPMKRKLIVAIFLIATVQVCAQAQNPRVTKGDAQKVVAIISGDKAKIQTYCDTRKLGEQIDQAYQKNDNKIVDELSEKLDTLEKNLGPEYVALIDGLQDIDPENDKLGEEILSILGALDRLCTR